MQHFLNTFNSFIFPPRELSGFGTSYERMCPIFGIANNISMGTLLNFVQKKVQGSEKRLHYLWVVIADLYDGSTLAGQVKETGPQASTSNESERRHLGKGIEVEVRDDLVSEE